MDPRLRGDDSSGLDSMAMQICSKCGYEGRGKSLGIEDRRGGGIARMLGVLLMLPIYTLWKMRGKKAGKQCPHCGLPTMVKVNSDAGRLARHMLDVELGLIQVKKPKEESPVDAFGTMHSAEKVTKKPVDPEAW